MTSLLSATIEPSPGGDDVTVTLRITNASGAPVEVVNPDMGQPSAAMNWPWSVEAYRAALLRSYGCLSFSVAEQSGEEVPIEPIETWATPVLRAPVQLEPGGTVDVPIPLARFFTLTPGRTYGVSAQYGDATTKVRGEGSVNVAAE